jgi:HlyD family secretion protein
VQNVVTYDAVIEFQNRDLKLFPGMTAYVTIPVATAENVVKLPNAALRFKPPLPPETLRTLYAKYGIDTANTDRAVVWKLHGDDTVEPVEVALGITDHTYTEVAKVTTGKLKPGDDVVTSSVTSSSSPPGAQGIRR